MSLHLAVASVLMGDVHVNVLALLSCCRLRLPRGEVSRTRVSDYVSFIVSGVVVIPLWLLALQVAAYWHTVLRALEAGKICLRIR